MKKYDSLMSKLDEEHIDMISSDFSKFTSKELHIIKNKFKERTMNKTNRMKKIVTKSLVTAACVCIAFVGVVNTNRTFAANLLDVPVLGEIVNIVTINKMDLHDKYSEINVDIPFVEGIEDNNVKEEINHILKKRSIAVYDKAIKNSEKIKENSEKTGFLTAMPEIVEQYYTIIRNDKDLLSFKVITTEIKASSYSTGYFYNVDLKNNKLLTISDLFKKDYDYIGVINKEIIAQMKEKIEKEQAGFFLEEFQTIDDDTSFYINENGKLVIVFNDYEISAGYMGMPEFVIDTSIFENNTSDLEYLK